MKAFDRNMSSWATCRAHLWSRYCSLQLKHVHVTVHGVTGKLVFFKCDERRKEMFSCFDATDDDDGDGTMMHHQR